jgi:hypothetical protein
MAGRCCSVTTSATRGLGYGCTGRDTAALLPSHSGAVPVTSHCLAWELTARALHRDDCYRDRQQAQSFDLGPPVSAPEKISGYALIHPRYCEQANDCDCDYQHELDGVPRDHDCSVVPSRGCATECRKPMWFAVALYKDRKNRHPHNLRMVPCPL